MNALSTNELLVNILNFSKGMAIKHIFLVLVYIKYFTDESKGFSFKV